MKLLKRFFIGLFTLIVLSAGTVFVVITFYKKELATLLTDTLKTNYGLTLKVEDVKVSFFSNWPHASVQLKNVTISSDLNTNPNEPILKAGSLALSLELDRMLRKEFIIQYVSLSDAEIILIKHEDGSRNFEFKKQIKDSTATPSTISFEVDKITLKRVAFNFKNKQKGQNIDINLMENTLKLKHYLDGIDAKLEGKILIGGLLFNPKNGEFLKHARAKVDIDATYFKETKTLCIKPPSYAEIDGHDYDLTSLIELGEKKKLSLQIQSKKVKCERVAALLTPKIAKVLSNFEVKRPVDAKILLVVNLGIKEDPVILVDVIGENCDLAIGKSKIPYSELYFTGKVISLHPSLQRGDMENARIIFSPVRGKVYDFPFTTSVKVTNLANAFIDIDASLLIDAAKIKFDVAKDFQLKGSALAKIKYSGPSKKLNKEEFLSDSMSLNAYLMFNDLSYKEIDRPYVYTVNGKANLNNHDLKFENMRLKTHVADAYLKGRADNFVDYVFGFRKGFKANVDVRTDLLDLNPLLDNKDTSTSAEKDKKKIVNNKISESKFEFNVTLFAKKMIVRKVETSNTSVNLFYKDNDLDIKSLSLNTCDGKITGKGRIEDFSKINADVSVQNVNVNTLFEQFENFGQDAIKRDNLSGNIFVDAKFKTELDPEMKIKGETMVGDVKLKLKDGHLINFEPVQNISNFLFRNRDFNDITFSELNEQFQLKGYEMKINELEIASNVLNLFVVDGLYNFKGNSNVNILVPWSNLKKRGKNYIPKSSGESAENTKGVKLNFSGPSKNMKISLGHKAQEKRFW